jgi:hypothetical protein
VWTELSPYEAAEYVDRRQVYIRTWPDGADIPTILLQDIRHIEKMPTAVDARWAEFRQYEAEESVERLGQMRGLLAEP